MRLNLYGSPCTRKHNLIKHLRVHKRKLTGNRKKKKSSSHVCKRCGKTYTRSDSLKHCVFEANETRVIKDIICQICKIAFKGKGILYGYLCNTNGALCS